MKIQRRAKAREVSLDGWLVDASLVTSEDLAKARESIVVALQHDALQ